MNTQPKMPVTPGMHARLGAQGIQEIASLVTACAAFSDEAGFVLATDAASFRVCPTRWQVQGRVVLDVQISCQTRGYRSIDWKGQPICLEAMPSQSALWIESLDEHGEVRFHDLPLGEYRVFFGLEALLADCRPPTEIDDYRNIELPQTGVGISMVREQTGVAFWAGTPNPALAGCRIVCCRRDRGSGRLERRGTIVLQQSGHDPSQLAGKFEEQLAFAGAGEEDLVFVVLPPEPKLPQP